ncbi:nickel transporter [Methyloligella sp. 2.7D]|uniref:HoxN/HupN/NixA family nickel/cobalt transporter n=1 Tax=unclassified Methyloligella TaxID=2625955 RepID=UPI00157BE054|nr:nickel transporter [Methyloligella sp. GL2]QKP76444.1 nickel transporter [Methyloligella sp. GL2]
MQQLTGTLLRLGFAAALLVIFALPGLGLAQSPPSAFGGSAQQSAPPDPQKSAAPPPAFGGAPSPEAAPIRGGGLFGSFISWVTEVQQRWQRDLALSVKHLKDGNPLFAALTLAGLSFAYGVVHALGPGHGKTIITAYVTANEETARRGVLVSFLAAAVQATTAVVLVAVLAILLNATGLAMKDWSAKLETASYALVILVGFWLLFRQIRSLLQRYAGALAERGDRAVDAHQHHHDHDHQHNHAHDHDHDGHACCSHGPDLEKLQGPLKLRELAAVVFSVGIRPCTGAIVVLVFALAQGIFWAGVGATFAMAFGTALTVAIIALAALGSRELVLKFGNGQGSAWADGVWAICGIGGALIIILFGSILLMGSLGPARPF